MADPAPKPQPSSPRKRGSSDCVPSEAKTLDPGLRRDDEQKQKPTRMRLGDITDSCLGKMLDKEKNRGAYQPYLANINVRWGGFDLSNLQEMRFEPSEEDRYGLISGDLVVCEGGEPGRCAIWREDRQGMKFQKALHRMRVKEGYSVEYLFYRMLLAGRTGELAQHFIGSTIKHLTGIGLAEVELEFPEFTAQKKIAAVLSALDAKIDLNHRINAELEALAKTIYDYWFVQFDFPDAHGRPYKSSGGAMVWNDALKREIPAEWEASKLSELVDVSTVSINPATDPDKVFNHLSIPGYDATGSFIVEYGRDIGSNKFSVAASDLLVSKLNPWFNRVFADTDHDDLICSTEFVVWRCGSRTRQSYLHAVATHPRFITYCTQSATSTSHSHKRVNPQVMMLYSVAYSAEQAHAFGELVAPMLQQRIRGTRENRELSHLRDWLLPLLMNGQVRVTSGSRRGIV